MISARHVLFFLIAAAPGAGGLHAVASGEPISGGWPLVENISAREALIPGAVWSIAEAREGEIVVGGNKLMLFDGDDWQPVEVETGYAFRALAADADGRVWVGGTGQLGFLAKDESGEWRFVSLQAQARAAGASAGEEIWHVAVTEAGPVFVASHRVLRWDGAKFTAWSLPGAPRLFAYTIHGHLFLHQPGVGLLRMDAAGPVLVRPAAQLPEGLILWAVAAPEGADADEFEWLIGTNDGAFRLRPGGAERLPELSEALAGELPTCAVMIDAGTVAVGTYQRGIVLADAATGRVLASYDRGAGLADDRVNQLAVDRRGRLWAGLSLGLARIEAADRVSVFDHRNGLEEGPVKRVFALDRELFASTSKAVYRLTPAPPDRGGVRFDPLLPGLNTFVWDTAVSGGEIFAAGFGGVWRRPAAGAPDAAPWRHEHHVSADVFRVVTSRFLADTLFFFEGHALKALQRTEREWVPRTLVPDLGDTPVSLLEDSGGDIWVSLMIDGVRRYRVVDDVDGLPIGLRLERRFHPGDGLPAGSVRPRLSLLGTHVVAFTETAILGISDQEETGSFAAVPGFENWTAVAGASLPDEGWWIVQNRAAGQLAAPALFRVIPGEGAAPVRSEPFEAFGLDHLRVVTSLDARPNGGHPATLWIGGASTLLKVEPVPAGPAPGLRLYCLSEDAGRASAARTGRAAGPSFADGTVGFAVFSSAAAAGEPVLFQTRLLGAETGWSPLQHEAGRKFVGLAPGRYTFQARAVDRWGRAGEPLAYGFTVPTPWYRGAAAILGYVLAGLALVGVVVGWRIRHLHRRAKELNRLVAERTRELAIANRAKADFLESISHEIRNPLNGIVGLVAMLREVALEPRAQEITRSLRACSRTLARLFNDVLSFTKLEHGQVAVAEKPFALDALVDELAALFGGVARERGSEIVVRREGEPLDRFVGDAEKIETILSNFVDNALKYAPGSRIEILLQCEAVDEFGADVTINVTDRGPGISPDEQEIIFQKFVRGSDAKRRRTSGTGLGLATCRALAELLGGHVGVESPPAAAAPGSDGPGSGSTFFLALRLKRDRHPALPLAPASVAGVAAGDCARALIVEDQPYNQIVVRRIAEQLGFVADVARGAAEALALFAANRYAVVLLDWELPDMKGDEVARRLRAHEGTRDVIIIATTAHDRDEIQWQGAAAGMDGFALKPFETETIARLIDQARVRRGRTGEAEAGELDVRVFRFVGYDDPAQAGQAAALYLELLDQELASLGAAVARRDRAGVVQAAHRLKSHAGMVGATALRDSAERLQSRAEDASAPLDELHREIAQRAERLRGEVRRWLDTATAK